MPTYTLSGRVVGHDGAPIESATVTVLEIVALTGEPPQKGLPIATDTNGRYTITWTESVAPISPWDVFVRAKKGLDVVESALISNLDAAARVDLVLAAQPYEGQTEWERVEAKLAPLLGGTAPKDVPVDRLEWLSRRADVFPTHAAIYVQAHRLAEARTIEARSCYAFLRAGLPSDLPGLLRAGEAAWASALRGAWSRRIVPTPGDGSTSAREQKVADELAAMLELVVDAAVSRPLSGVNQRVLLDTAGLSDAQQRTFTQLWLGHSGAIEDFWTSVSSSGLASEVPTLKFTIQAATLVGAHESTLAALQAERSDATVSELADAAAWSVAQWDTMLAARGVTPPPDIPGADASETRQTYARALHHTLERAYPSPSVAAALVRDEQANAAPPNTTFVAAFLATNADFDIVEGTLAVHLESADSPWAGIAPADQAQARANIEQVQRVYRMSPPIARYETARVLLEQGIRSATQVVASTRSEFMSKLGPLLPAVDHDPQALAGAVWDNAAKIHSLVVGLSSQLALTKTSADALPVAMPGAEQFSDAPGGLAELSTILGNLDYCACTHCRSVFSPAAYLADLLAFLKARPAAQAANALEVLLARRPDLAHILLDCANTNTPLPYIDLVNELLEDFIDGGLGPSSKQTTWTAAELRLHPEHLDASAYEGATLTQRVHPWTLPFSLPTVEAQTYLRHLGVPRHELMRRVARLAPSDDELDARAGDLLGLDLLEFRIVAGLRPGNPDGREFWGFDAPANNWVGLLNGTDPEGDIGELLVRGRLELAELRELLSLGFIKLDTNIAAQWAETCELDDASIAFLEAPALDRLHRFVRLQRATKIPSRMLDVLICDVLGEALDRPATRQLAEIVALQGRLRLRWDELATFWANRIDARDGDDTQALYTRRFLSRDLGPVDPDFAPAGDGSQLFGETNPATAITSAQLPRVLAGLGLSERDYQLLAASSLASDAFSFANFTALFRSVALSRALQISVAELVRLVELTSLDPFADPLATAALADQVQALHSSGFSLDELDWILRHESSGSELLDKAAVTATLAGLARGLLAIDDETGRLEDPDGQALAQNLTALLEPAELTTTLEVVDRTTTLTLLERDAFLDSTFADVLDADAAKAVLSDYENQDWLDVALRRAWLLARVVAHLRRRALVLDTIRERLGLPAPVAEALATEVLSDPTRNAPLLELYRLPFATREELDAGLTPSTHPSAFAGWIRLNKAALVCERFGLRADEVTWYSGHSGWLDLDALPLDTNDPAASFESWERLRKALALRGLSRPGEIAAQEIAEQPTLADAIAVLADHAGWDAAAVLALAQDLGYDDTHAAAVAQEVIPAQLALAVETADRLGVGLELLRGWASPTPSLAETAAIKAATRAKYGEDRWPEVAKPLRDVIRERQRDALVDAALAITPAFRTPNDVFEHLLIDVEMSACMMSSRIKQAIASVQIFIHRVLLHLDLDEVSFDPEAIARWDWMKNYRVWEANRKVFLYPENWIEPELRADKTPQFEELEANLTQGVLDTRTIENSLSAYLESLVRVANLEMIGVYEHPQSGELWLLARTHASPHEWFVRRRLAAGTWEAWAPVPANIDSDAAVVLMHKGRLHVFWATRHEDALPDKRIVYRFRVHHIERGPDGWGKPTTSKLGPKFFVAKHEFRLHFVVVGRSIVLTVLWQQPNTLEGRPGVAGAFTFDLVEQRAGSRASWMGSHSEEVQVELGDETTADVEVLDDKGLIALQSDYYAFEGQRNAKFDGLDVDLGEGWSSARFVQGDINLPLFERPSSGRRPAFVHQADIWTPHANTTMRPAIYDDRLRKYLLEPGYASTLKEADPNAIGQLTPAQLVLCPPLVQAIDLTPKPKRGVRKLRDGVHETLPWADGVPGLTPALNTLDTPDKLEAPVFMHGLLLTKSQVLMQGKVEPEHDDDDDNYPAAPLGLALDMVELYHPFARDLQEALATEGVAGLYAPPTSGALFRQQKTHDPFGAEGMGLNLEAILGKLPTEAFDFEFDSPYATYNWEIFYHVPMRIAGKLATEQRWDEAQRWYHLIFNPIDLVELPGETAASKFWRIKPFFEQAATLAKDQLEIMLGIGVGKAEQQAAIDAFARQVATWEANPFDPHAVARVRPGVYQRALLREYFDNLIAWADHLFRRDTIESITEATVLYIVVAQLLGPRPQEVPGPQEGANAKTFAQLDALGLDAFANAMIQLESWIHLPAQPVEKLGCGEAGPSEPWVRVPVVSHFWYFCYPPNPELLKYWDVLADRLFKIRHCQNIEGVERQLPLFQPPIDPALLVRATAAGVDLQSVLAQRGSGLPPYRFRSVHARAAAFAGSLRALGASLLAALEKRDAEALARLRSGQELELLGRVRDIRRERVDEAKEGIASLEATREVVRARHQHYTFLSRAPHSTQEKLQFSSGRKAQRDRSTAQDLQMSTTIMSALPQVSVIPPDVSFGGMQLANVMNAISAGFGYSAAEHDYNANRSGLTASFQRRSEEWSLSIGQAELELERLERDLVAAQIRLEIAERELDNHDLAVEHAEAVDEYMRTKFTHRELYDWMTRQLAQLYFSTYQLAFDLAKRAERAYRHELAIDEDEAPIIEYGYWDNLHRGLLAGERLGHDLERLDLAYMDRDVREFELRKSVSLAELDPTQLQTLRETGACSFELPEVLYDLDHPGHYLRRLRAVRITIPAVVGPYTSLGASLQLLTHKTRRDALGDYAEEPVGSDARFAYGTGAGQSVATSTAVSDGGLFNLDFRDERYLPFEYAGALSTWKLELPGALRQFDYRTIEDLIVHIDYTARSGGRALRTAAEASLVERFNQVQGEGEPLSLILVLDEAFPNEWQRFGEAQDGEHLLSLPILAEHFPYLARHSGFQITAASFALILDPTLASANLVDIEAQLDAVPAPQDFVQAPGDAFMTTSFALAAPAQPTTWTLTIAANAIPPELQSDGALDTDKLAGMVLVLRYALDATP